MSQRKRSETAQDSATDSDRQTTAHTTDTERATGTLTRLHQHAGNRSVQRMADSSTAGDPPARGISDPGDASERAADRVARSVMGMRGSVVGSRQDADGPHQKADPSDTAPVSATAPHPMASVTGSGEPLEPSTRSFFERRFGTDFGDVRVHTGMDADRAARAVSAEAFTYGTDLVFRRGRYDPDRSRGKSLLAHELAHVIQQDAAGTRYLQRNATATTRQPRSLTQSLDPAELSDRELRTEIRAIRRWLGGRSASTARTRQLRETLSSLESEHRRRDTDSSNKAATDRESDTSGETTVGGMTSAEAPASVPATHSSQEQESRESATTGRGTTSAETPASVPAQEEQTTSTPQPRSLTRSLDPAGISDRELRTEIRAIRRWLSRRSTSSRRARRLRQALSSLEAEVRDRNADQSTSKDSADRPTFPVKRLSDRQLRRAITLSRRKARTETDQQAQRTLRRLKAEYRRRQKKRIEEGMEQYKESDPGFLGAVLPGRTKPYYKDPSKSIENPTVRALTSGSKEQTFGGLMAGQEAARASATAGLIAGGTIIVAVGGATLVSAGATAAVKTQAGGYLLHLAATNPVKTQALAEFTVGVALDIALEGGIEEYVESLATAGGAAGMALEVVTLAIPLKTGGEVRVKAEVESVDDSGKVTVKVQDKSMKEAAESTPRAKEKSETETPSERSTSGKTTPSAGTQAPPARTKGLAQAKKKGYPTDPARIPDGHHWHGTQSGEPRLHRNPGSTATKHVYDRQKGEFVKKENALPNVQGYQVDPSSREGSILRITQWEGRPVFTGKAAKKQKRILNQIDEVGHQNIQKKKQLGDEYRDLVADKLGVPMRETQKPRSVRTIDFGLTGEATLEGRKGKFRPRKIRQLLRQIKASPGQKAQVLLAVPKLSDQAARQLRRVKKAAETEFEKQVRISVLETAPEY